jgi:hypothetical protein
VQLLMLLGLEEVPSFATPTTMRVYTTRRDIIWLNRFYYTQPVMIQSFVDEFDLPTDGPIPNTAPAETGQVLSKGEQGMQMPIERQKKYRSGTGKLLHMMRWSRPDVLNAVRECSKFMSGAWENHMGAMQRIMRYVVNTAARVLPSFSVCDVAVATPAPASDSHSTASSTLLLVATIWRRSSSSSSTF